MSSFKDKVIWITGASSGLGEALAYKFAADGAKLILSARRKDLLDAIKQKIGHAEILPLDLEDKSELEGKTQQALSFFGHIDIMIHNAAIAQRSTVLETSPEIERKIMEVDYFGCTDLTHYLLPHFTERQQGHIVVISGLLADIHLPGRSTYAAAKAALIAYFGCLRAEIHKKGIDVTVLIPGAMQTDLGNKALNGNGISIDGHNAKSGCPLDKAAEQIARAIEQKTFQAFIGNRDKSFIMWKLSKLFPNFVITKLLKSFP